MENNELHLQDLMPYIKRMNEMIKRLMDEASIPVDLVGLLIPEGENEESPDR